ncbi:MAG TPA: DUF1361 domain-containing protein [Solirubrobacterales bacterium]|nr:DUF1361 domain-containing protein [Solirubrobacterales bacterium]
MDPAHPILGNTWMVWNTFLALIPALLALRLFRAGARRTVGWWIGAVAFMAFLPNAAYVLTDVIHLPTDLRAASNSVPLTFAVLGAYAAFAVIGFAAYAYSVLRLVGYLREQGLSTVGLVVAELSVHFLATIGVILGRVFRFNSWDVIARPGEIVETLRLPQTEWGIAVVAFVLVTITVGTLFVRLLVDAARRTHRPHSR